jgi:hypothetical protein
MREKDAFASLDVREQVWRFMNWQSRLVHPHPREVYRANGFDDLAIVQTNRFRVEALLASLALGGEVTAYLSNGIKQGYCLHSPGRKDGQDFDLLLNEWGIHHLHLRTNDLRAESNELLYVILCRAQRRRVA